MMASMFALRLIKSDSRLGVARIRSPQPSHQQLAAITSSRHVSLLAPPSGRQILRACESGFRRTDAPGGVEWPAGAPVRAGQGTSRLAPDAIVPSTAFASGGWGDLRT